MPIGEICVREVVICNRSTTIREAAQLMRQHHVGDLVVVGDTVEKRAPVGIVTDRDIVISAVAADLDPRVASVNDVMSGQIFTVREDRGIFDTIQEMRIHGIRRMPVVDQEGGLVGIVSIDDLLQLLADEISELAKLVSKEQAQEAQRKRVA